MSAKEIFGWFMFGVVIVVVFGGLGKLLAWDATRDAKARQEQCATIAKLAEGKEHVEKDYTCSFIKDGHLVQVEV